VTLHVPFRVVKRGGRKEMQLPEGATQPRRTDNTLVKALARAFRWKRMLESGEFATIAELAEREGIAPSYMTRVLRLTLLAPDIVEAILEPKAGCYFADRTQSRASEAVRVHRAPILEGAHLNACAACPVFTPETAPLLRNGLLSQRMW
jgi:hypothetical protein